MRVHQEHKKNLHMVELAGNKFVFSPAPQVGKFSKYWTKLKNFLCSLVKDKQSNSKNPAWTQLKVVTV